MEITEAEVIEAAAKMVEAFSNSRTEDYFACFDEHATFLFHGEGSRLETRAAYQSIWEGWMEEGLRITSCKSTNRRIQIHGAVALLTHDVETDLDDKGSLSTAFERETIVFAKNQDGTVSCLHEHLSLDPTQN
ncbi:Ketosteroid isomerase homolog [Arthrobacter sp. cf158]|uniref:YybH family protein n=1 Tax=Arthrobacter sp. cf158 TaxID=1761744 RepID=UPI00089A6ADD|nr:nuclear transport factor 2 family protein [Arthrobacter sp. cf158]SDW91253.1 Ketosteroid isomerase homolog [Arthrobacter sp. cf158]